VLKFQCCLAKNSHIGLRRDDTAATLRFCPSEEDAVDQRFSRLLLPAVSVFNHVFVEKTVLF